MISDQGLRLKKVWGLSIGSTSASQYDVGAYESEEVAIQTIHQLLHAGGLHPGDKITLAPRWEVDAVSLEPDGSDLIEIVETPYLVDDYGRVAIDVYQGQEMIRRVCDWPGVIGYIDGQGRVAPMPFGAVQFIFCENVGPFILELRRVGAEVVVVLVRQDQAVAVIGFLGEPE